MKSVLIVDDKEENLYYLRCLFEGNGWVVEAARHGAEALVKARARPPHLVVSDLLMPVMDGYTLLRHWKADENLKRAPFVVYTATYTRAEDERLALTLGADSFILKPSEPVEFLSRVESVLVASERRGPDGERQAGDTEEQLKLYSETLIRKLEEKTLQLEEANRALQEDIQKRQAVEETLRKRDALLRIAGAAARLGGWSVEIPSRRVTWSDEVCAIHELPPGTEPLMEQVVEFYAPEFRETIRQALQACACAGKPFDLELQLITSPGKRAWVRAIGQAERDETGAIVRIQGAIQDISEWHKLQGQLQQSQKMEAVGLLAGGVAHDFNNILVVILGYTSLVLDELAPDTPFRPDLEEVRKAGERAADLIRHLLAFGRQQTREPRRLDVGEVVQGMRQMLGRLLGEAVELHLQVDTSIGEVLADPTQLEQVVMNLAVNARDAMPRGGTLSIEVARVDDPKGDHEAGYVRLTVADTGVGMDAQTRERIFEPFFTTKEKGKGTGLGLSTVFGIVKQNHGHMQVFSEPGRGSSFEVYLPVAVGRDDVVEPPAPPYFTSLQGTETILVVEDEDPVRLMTCTILRRNGYHVLEAQNGGEAFLISERNTETRIALLISDVVMPRMNGPELAERLLPTRPEMGVLFVSGYAEHASRELPREFGTMFLPKPFTPEALLQKVREVLDLKSALSP